MPASIIAPGYLVKHPDESLVYAMDFANLLGAGELLTAVANSTPLVDVVSTPPLVFGTPSIVGTQIRFRVSGGQASMDYRITVEAATSAANTRAAVGVLFVRA